MSVEKGELEKGVQSISFALMQVVSNLHNWSDNETVPGNIVRGCLEDLVLIHSTVKGMEPVCGRIDSLLAELGGRALAPESAAPFTPSDD